MRFLMEEELEKLKGPCLLELFSSILSFSDHVMVLTMMGPLMDSAVILASIVVEVASD
ncbi:hypothetical protein SETIT_3G206700v2 [Setaria italica]|uniref:Uncharacterized protein n=1 Tax=Setaria italica TaxID=4555 RepID=A0A368QH05_SETIT|nr:hypothetical protein SETIT_3G206700v2 [Setaria italica]RCV17268.1 hypothetical protein SETIT_3G206700v2 [Setaria italica]